MAIVFPSVCTAALTNTKELLSVKCTRGPGKVLAGSYNCTPVCLSARRRLIGRASTHDRVVANSVSGVAEAPVKQEKRPLTDNELQGFMKGYDSIYEENDLPILDSMVEGTIPAEIEGTFLRNGPGLFEVGGTKIPQPFDGDGMIVSMSFKDGKAYFRNRYVRTAAFVEEQKAGKLLYQGVFNKSSPDNTLLNNPLAITVKKVANTGVVHWAGRLLALYEADVPYELRADLTTVGTTTLNGAVPPDAPRLAAHYRVVQQKDGSKRWVTFGTSESPSAANFVFNEFAEDGSVVSSKRVSIQGAGLGLFHDLLVTDNYYVLLENPIRLDVLQLLGGYVFKQCSFASCLKFREDLPTKLHLVPRGSDSTALLSFELPPFFSFHHVNAFECGDGRHVVVDSCAMMGGVDLSADADNVKVGYYADTVGRGSAMRFVVDKATGKVSSHRLFLRSCDFPVVPLASVGKQHKVAFFVGDDLDDATYYTPPQSLIKAEFVGDSMLPDSVKIDVFNPGYQRFVGEPVFVPRENSSAEDDGWLMCYVFDAVKKATDLVILDAKTPSAGPVATIHLPVLLPFGLHGYWTGSYLGPEASQWGTTTRYDIRNGVAHKDGSYKYT